MKPDILFSNVFFNTAQGIYKFRIALPDDFSNE